MQRTAYLLLLVFLAMAGCGGPPIVLRYDEASDTTRLELRPISLGFLGFPRMSLETEFSGSHLLPPGETFVIAKFKYKDFDRLYLFAEGQRFSYHRLRFHEQTAAIPLSDLVLIGASNSLAVGFDTSEDRYEITGKDLKLIQKFASRAEGHYEKTRLERQSRRSDG